MKKMHLALAAALVLGSATVVSAQGGGAPPQGQPGRGPNRMMEMLFKDITLTDAQKTKVDSIMGAYREQMMAIPRGPDATDADRAKRQELSKKQQTDIRAVLTADQQKTFDANIAAMPTRPQGQGGGRPPA
jgi:periplasmic protein CpxP/Spy